MAERFGESFGIRYLFRMVCEYTIIRVGWELMVEYH
jgi:hypothetical protein